MIGLGVDGVVLDVDDTLYLERSYVRSGFEAVGRWLAEQTGIEGFGAVAWQLFLDGLRGTTIGDALDRVGADGSLLGPAVEQYRTHRPDIELLPDAAAWLAALPAHVPVAVVTDGPRASQHAKCEALGLVQRADRVVVTQDFGTSKPDPRVFEAAVEGWGIAPERLVYVADNPHKDFLGPAELGWRSVRVRRPDSLHFSVPTPEGVAEVSCLDEVVVPASNIRCGESLRGAK